MVPYNKNYFFLLFFIFNNNIKKLIKTSVFGPNMQTDYKIFRINKQ